MAKNVLERASIYKSSCKSWPSCEQKNKSEAGLLLMIGAPARRAPLGKNIDSLMALSRYTKKEVANLHGIGQKAISISEDALKEIGLTFKKNDGKI